MQSSELESGLPDEAEQESIVFSFLEAVVNVSAIVDFGGLKMQN